MVSFSRTPVAFSPTGLMFALVAWQSPDQVMRITLGDIQRIEEQWWQQMRRTLFGATLRKPWNTKLEAIWT